MYQPDAYSWTTRRFSPLSSTMRACRPARTVRRRFDRARLPVQTQQQGEGESGTLARNALHLSHDVHQLFGDRQPQACAAVAAGCRRVCLRKFLKQTVQFFPAQLPIPVSLIEIATHARFPSASPHLTAIKTWPDCVNLTALLARDQYLSDPAAITEKMAWSAGRILDNQIEPPFFRMGLQHFRDFLHHPQIERIGFRSPSAGLDRGEIQNVVDHGEQRFP